MNRRGFLAGLLGAVGLGSICNRTKAQEDIPPFVAIEGSRWSKVELTSNGKTLVKSGGWVRFDRELSFVDARKGIANQYFPPYSGCRVVRGEASNSLYEKNLWHWKLTEEEITPVQF